MIEKLEQTEQFERVFDEFTTDKFYRDPISLQNINDNSITSDIRDNEMVFDGSRIGIKSDGVIKEMIVEDNKVIIR